MSQVRSRIDNLHGLSVSLGKNYLVILVAIANDLNDLILILWGKGLYVEAEGEGNGGKSVLCNLKDTAIL